MADRARTTRRPKGPTFWQSLVDAVSCRADPCKASCQGSGVRQDSLFSLLASSTGSRGEGPRDASAEGSGHEDEDSDNDEGLEWQPTTYTEGGGRYTGQWKARLRHGEGVLEQPDGGRYEGSFRRGKAQGHGCFTAAANGMVYVGQWRADRAHGEGTCTKAGKSVYKGQWVRDKKSGAGSELWSDSSCYNGLHLLGKKHGNGVYWSPDGISYDGQFRNDLMHGEGKYTFAGGSYVGQFELGKISQKGKMSWPSGAVYEGEYKGGEKCGEGKMSWPDGRVYRGQWLEGEQHGTGVDIDVHGNITRGTWCRGALVDGLDSTANTTVGDESSDTEDQSDGDVIRESSAELSARCFNPRSQSCSRPPRSVGDEHTAQRGSAWHA